MSQQTVTINGIIYDAQTGLPLRKAPEEAVRATTPRAHHSQNVHQVAQKSATLNRAFVKKAAPSPLHKVIAKPAPAVKPQMSTQKSPAITRFATHPTGVKPAVRRMDIGPKSHPVAQKTHAKIQQNTPAPVTPATHAVKPSHIIKNEAISEAMEKAPKHTANAKHVKQPRKHSRTLSLMSASLALIMLAGYFTYLNMPNLSVRVAAAQAGFEATYPGYHPDGYRINKVAYAEGQVGIQYVANGSEQGFTVKQEKSGWDSSALLANYVEPTSKGGYIPHSEQGITVYVFDNNAAWVNDGIRYTINGNAPLSSDQILDIATSM